MEATIAALMSLSEMKCQACLSLAFGDSAVWLVRSLRRGVRLNPLEGLSVGLPKGFGVTLWSLAMRTRTPCREHLGKRGVSCDSLLSGWGLCSQLWVGRSPDGVLPQPLWDRLCSVASVGGITLNWSRPGFISPNFISHSSKDAKNCYLLGTLWNFNELPSSFTPLHHPLYHYYKPCL